MRTSKTILPMHGQEIGNGLEHRIKKDLGLKYKRGIKDRVALSCQALKGHQ